MQSRRIKKDGRSAAWQAEIRQTALFFSSSTLYAIQKVKEGTKNNKFPFACVKTRCTAAELSLFLFCLSELSTFGSSFLMDDSVLFIIITKYLSCCV